MEKTIKIKDRHGVTLFLREDPAGWRFYQNNRGRNVELPHTEEWAYFSKEGQFLGIRQGHWPEKWGIDPDLEKSIYPERIQDVWGGLAGIIKSARDGRKKQQS